MSELCQSTFVHSTHGKMWCDLNNNHEDQNCYNYAYDVDWKKKMTDETETTEAATLRLIAQLHEKVDYLVGVIPMSKFRVDWDEDTEIEGVVAQAMGYASACWSNLSGAGTFQSVQCKTALDQLMSYLREMFPLDDKVFERGLQYRMGYRDGAETTADGSMDNDLAHERVDVAREILVAIREHSNPDMFIRALRRNQLVD